MVVQDLDDLAGVWTVVEGGRAKAVSNGVLGGMASLPDLRKSA